MVGNFKVFAAGTLIGALALGAAVCGVAMADSGFIRVAEDRFTFETPTGDRFLPMGAYYLDERHPEIDPLHWWGHFNEEHVEYDFAMAKWLGCNTLRLSFHFEVIDRNPEKPVVGSEEDFRKCSFLLDCAQRNGLKLYIGPKIDGSSPQVTQDLYLWNTAVKNACSRYKNHPAVFCWEMDWENITLVGYEGDREIWNNWVTEKYGSFDKAARAWKVDASKEGWQDAVWTEMRNLLHHTGAYDEKRQLKPGLWYLDILNKTNDQKLYDWQLYRDHLYTWKISQLLITAREADPNHLICIDLICWSFPLLRNNIQAGYGGPYGYAGVDVKAISEHVDFFGIHTYPMYMPPFSQQWYENLSRDKKTRQNQLRYIATLCRYLRENTGKPIVHSETGWHGGEGDYYNNGEQDQLDWAEDVMQETKHCAVGWINWTLKDVPTHEKLTAFGGLVTKGIKTKADKDGINPLSAYLYDGRLPKDEAYRPKLIGKSFKKLVEQMHADPNLRPVDGKKVVVSKRFAYTADLKSLDEVLVAFMGDEHYPCDISLEDIPARKDPVVWK
ncbi:MAG: hypothetical protein ABFR33_10210 [Verrucomicrobiota bacterium]